MSSHVDEGLTFKQNAFVTHFVSPETFGNGTQSARRARFSGDDNTLAVTASRLLRNNKVQNAIQKRVKGIMDANECLTELSDVARLKPKKTDALNGNHKMKALELVGKAHNLFGENQQNQLQDINNIIQSLSQFGINSEVVAQRLADEIERRELEARTVDVEPEP